MSFSADTKNELAHIMPEKKNCMIAEIAAFIRVRGNLRLMGGGKFEIQVPLDDPAIARHFMKLIKEYFSVETHLTVRESSGIRKGRSYIVTIGPEDLSEQFKAMTLEIAPLDREGNKVINVLVYPETVSFRAAAGYTKEVRLVVPVKDESEDSYERTYTTPETVVIKGKRSTIDSFSGITANEIDIAYYYEDSEIPIEFDFPEGVSIADGQDQLLLKLKVVEKKQKEKDKDKENDSENESDNENG